MSGAEMSIESQRVGDALPESEEHYRAVAEAASDAIITFDSDCTILIANPATERIFRYSSEEMIGQPLTMLMPEYLCHLHKAGITRYLETGRKHIQWSAVQLPGLDKTGNEIPLEISFAEFTRDGRRFFTGIARVWSWLTQPVAWNAEGQKMKKEGNSMKIVTTGRCYKNMMFCSG